MPLDIDLRKGCRRDAATFFVQKHTTLKPFTKMATVHKNLSDLGGKLPSAAGMKFGIVVSEWNEQITEAPAARCGKNPQGGGMRRAEYHHQTCSGHLRAPLGRPILCGIHRCRRRDRLGLRHSGRNPTLRLRLHGGYTGNHPTHVVVEHAGRIRRIDYREPSAGVRPCRRKVWEQRR